ncbi:MAG: hypothetical protein N3E50_00415 [Candidatus Goldbacteria bacterium]|nr:hypothetical protein [Candidatus Goldiibacteriota bacterium]
MKKVFIFVLVLLLLFNFNIFAKTKKVVKKTTTTTTTTYVTEGGGYYGGYKGARGFGAGIIIGLASGLSLKNWIDSVGAIQIDASWNFDYGAFGVGVAYLFHNFDLIRNVQDSKLPVYFGIKGWLAFSPHAAVLGVQVPLGIVWIPRAAPIDIFLQFEPGISIIPGTHWAYNAGIGIRYYF